MPLKGVIFLASFLLAIIYISFISLGLPDALLGGAWPTIHNEFGVPVSVARDAGECTTLGAGYMADHFDMLGGNGKENA